MNKVWLVTGSASGLGRNIAEAVLESRDRLVVTARDPRRLDDLVINLASASARFLLTWRMKARLRAPCT
jgi:NAD(P)-dependent dehydrogenase (short-subunit alcohol dehydrogenase family)